METWIKEAGKKWGAFLLGTVILVVVWRIIAQPMLDKQDTQRAEDRNAFTAAKDELAAATTALKTITESQRQVAMNQETTAKIMERVVDKLLLLDRR